MKCTRNFALEAPVATSPKMRRCALAGCNTVLSIYNHGRYCSLHADEDAVVGAVARCVRCGEVKPLTEDYWHHDNTRASGWNHACKSCRQKADRRSRKGRRRLNTSGKKAKLVRCSRCGQTYERSGTHWSFNSRGALVQPCLRCQEKAKEDRRRKALDKYYKRRYGLTRDEYISSFSERKGLLVESPNRILYWSESEYGEKAETNQGNPS